MIAYRVRVEIVADGKVVASAQRSFDDLTKLFPNPLSPVTKQPLVQLAEEAIQKARRAAK